ncbi:MAG: hypothetical protein WCG93_05960 [Paludibacter sp.]
MTQQDFITLIKQQNSATAENMPDLKEMVDHYPYFAPARILLAKVSQQSNSIHYSRNLKLAALYSASRRWLYYYIHPEKALSTESYRRIGVEKPSGGYFDMMQAVENEGGDTKQSLKDLAERLKAARSMVVNPTIKPVIISDEIVEEKVIVLQKKISEDYFAIENVEISENEAKKLIKERKYKQAISILRELNLSNPKKSVYFADQIRFLEKVIENSKK